MINFYLPQSNGNRRPLIITGIPAGHPEQTPNDFVWVDLDDLLSTNPAATIYGRINGFSMFEAEIYDGDLLIINTDVEPSNGDICVVRLNGEITCKFWKDVLKLGYSHRHLFLVPANGDFESIQIKEPDDIEIIGVVDYVIHKKRHRSF